MAARWQAGRRFQPVSSNARDEVVMACAGTSLDILGINLPSRNDSDL